MLNKFKETIEEIKKAIKILELSRCSIDEQCHEFWDLRELRSNLNQHYKTSLIWANDEIEFLKKFEDTDICYYLNDNLGFLDILFKERLKIFKEIKKICEENLK